MTQEERAAELRTQKRRSRAADQSAENEHGVLAALPAADRVLAACLHAERLHAVIATGAGAVGGAPVRHAVIRAGRQLERRLEIGAH